VGFMGCGKTEVARELAVLRNEQWADLDDLIGKGEGRSPAEIITNDGEAVFRERETSMLQSLLMSGAERVIALGGGAWTIPRNRELVREHDAVAVWLDAPFDLCWRRIEAAGQARPLAPNRDAAQRLYLERGAIYSLADFRVSVADESPTAIAGRIAVLLRQ
jgi:shikimate kinase